LSLTSLNTEHDGGPEHGTSEHYAGSNGHVFSLKHIQATVLHFSNV